MKILDATRTAVVWLSVRLQTLRSEKGATAVEYGIMVALIAVVIISVVIVLGEEIRDTFKNVVNSIPGGKSL